MFIIGKFVDWDRRKTEEAIENDNDVLLNAKMMGLGALEGVIDSCLIVGALFTIASVAKEAVEIIKK